jgi:hypothetical protein
MELPPSQSVLISVEMAEEPATGARRSSRQFVPVQYVRSICIVFLVALALPRSRRYLSLRYTPLTLAMHSTMHPIGLTSRRLLGRSVRAMLPLGEERLALLELVLSVVQAGVLLRLKTLTLAQAKS